MAANDYLAPKPLRKKLALKNPNKRCNCGNVVGDKHYQCSLCTAKASKKKRIQQRQHPYRK